MKIIRNLVLFLILFLCINVYAAGPSSDGYIKVRLHATDDDTIYLYNNGNQEGTVPNITYNSSTNTLEFNNYSDYDNPDTNITLYNMGDMKININGVNNVTGTNSYFIKLDNTNIVIDGTGTLNIYGIGIGSENDNVTVKNITLNGYGLLPGYLVNTSNGNLVLENIESNFFNIDNRYCGGFHGNVVSVTGSDIYGIAPGIIAENAITIENTDLKFIIAKYAEYPYAINSKNGSINITNSNIIIEGENLDEHDSLLKYVDGRTGVTEEQLRTYVFTKKPYTENIYTYPETLGIVGVGDLNITGGSIYINGAGICLGSEDNIEITNAGVNLRCLIGIGAYNSFGETKVTKKLTLNSGSITVSDSIQGIHTSDLVINDGTIRASIISDALKDEFETYMNNNDENTRNYLNSLEYYTLKADQFTLADTHVMYLDSEDYKNIDTSNGLSANNLFEAYPKPGAADPDSNNNQNNIIEVIKNVPKTGIVTFISLIFGIQLLIVGGYLIINRTKKETIK